jgi:hypothetical protein
MTAALVAANDTVVKNSGSNVPFSITIAPMMLTIEVPANVSVSVDGAIQRPGPAQVPVSAGSHNITLPTSAQVNDTIRLMFDSWSDGFAIPNRTVTLTASSTFRAIYVTQYRLTIAGKPNLATGEGWYDPGSTAPISVPDTVPMTGILGLLGGKLRFQAWYEDGEFLTNSSMDIIVVNRPHTLTVAWQHDYTMPLVILMTIVTVLILTSILVHRRTISARKRRTRSTRSDLGKGRKKRPKSTEMRSSDRQRIARERN